MRGVGFPVTIWYTGKRITQSTGSHSWDPNTCNARHENVALEDRLPSPLFGVPPNSSNIQQIDDGDDKLYRNDRPKQVEGILWRVAISWNCDIH